MKSIMQEASSIAKAIEQAWMTAGQPAEFTIKVLEEPQKNFIGFTTRSAKIALFFEMAPSAKPQAPKAKPAVSRHTEAKVMQPKPVIQEREQKEPVAPRQAHSHAQAIQAILERCHGQFYQGMAPGNIEPDGHRQRTLYDRAI